MTYLEVAALYMELKERLATTTVESDTLSGRRCVAPVCRPYHCRGVSAFQRDQRPALSVHVRVSRSTVGRPSQATDRHLPLGAHCAVDGASLPATNACCCSV